MAYDFYDDEEDTSFWESPNPSYHNSGFHGSSGSIGTSRCPNCGSYNTFSTTYVDGCNTCGESDTY